MKRLPLFIILLSCLCYEPAYSFISSVGFFKGDSLPDQQNKVLFRSRLFVLAEPGYERTHKQMLTLFIQPSEAKSDREVTLPVGVDMRTVSIRSGEELLQLEKDYVFLPTINRFRILNEVALNSRRPIRIAYERPNLTMTTGNH